MTETNVNVPRASGGLWRISPLVVLPILWASGACLGLSELPAPRPLVVHSGVRLIPPKERMEAIDAWFHPQDQHIRKDPTFLIDVLVDTTSSGIYPWEGLEIIGDTARVRIGRGTGGAGVVFGFFGFYRLMVERGELEKWIPEAAAATGYQLERSILNRVADAWLYGRSIWDVSPYAPLDELIYAQDAGFLDAFILTARADEFGEERRKWLDDNPGALEAYREWFRETFSREPPGMRGEKGS